MPGSTTRGLADLHVHLYGAIRADDYLEYVSGRRIDWSPYESAYAEAFDAQPRVRELLERHALGEDVEQAWRRLFVFGPEDVGSFSRFQAKFDLLLAGSAFRSTDTAGDLSALSAELRFFVERIQHDQAEQGIGYAEHRLLFGASTPAEHVAQLGRVVLEAFAADGRTTSRLALSLPRADPWPGWAVAQELALSPLGEWFTGVDFCFREEGHPPREKAALFAAIHAFNQRNPERALAILYHVGESFTDKSLESAVRWVEQSAALGAHRLGHAIALGVSPAVFGEHERYELAAERRDQIAWDLEHADGLAAAGVPVDASRLADEDARLAQRGPDERLPVRYDAARLAELGRRQDYAMDRVRGSGSVVEVCPTSNLRIGGIRDPRQHPVHRFIERGVPFVVASDDPGIFGTTLQAEHDWVVRQAGLDDEGRDELAARSWRCRSEVLTGRVHV